MTSSKTRQALLLSGAFATLLAVAAMVGVAACRARGGDAVDLAEFVPTASPTSTLTPEQEAAEQALAAYNGFHEAYVSAAAIPEFMYPDLALFAADPLLAEARYALYTMGLRGVVYTGRPVHDPRVTAVNLEATPPTVDIEDCLDSTGWHVVRQSDGSDASAPGQAERYLVTSQVVADASGRWFVRQSTPQRDQAC